MQNEIQDKAQRFKLLAIDFFKHNIPIFIKDINNQYYMGYQVSEPLDSVFIECFSPKEKKGTKHKINFLRIIDLNEYKEQ